MYMMIRQKQLQEKMNVAGRMFIKRYFVIIIHRLLVPGFPRLRTDFRNEDHNTGLNTLLILPRTRRFHYYTAKENFVYVECFRMGRFIWLLNSHVRMDLCSDVKSRCDLLMNNAGTTGISWQFHAKMVEISPENDWSSLTTPGWLSGIHWHVHALLVGHRLKTAAGCSRDEGYFAKISFVGKLASPLLDYMTHHLSGHDIQPTRYMQLPLNLNRGYSLYLQKF